LSSTVYSAHPCSRNVAFGAGGGRKIAIVVDSSSSMGTTDPSDLRIAAAKDLNDRLTSKSEAGPKRDPDLVTVVDFDDSANIVYNLGDPASATFDGINSAGGTYIAGGIKAAIDELIKDLTIPTKGRTGIVVLTDGNDSYKMELLNELDRAQNLGIRVSFGFLMPTVVLDQDILTKILKTGGVYSTIDSAEAQQSFVHAVIANGPTELDRASGPIAVELLPGLSLAGLISAKTGPRTFTYDARAGEKLNFTINSLPHQTLTATLRGAPGANNSATTDNTGIASIITTGVKQGKLELVVKSTNATEGTFTVGLGSSLGSAYNCTAPPHNGTQLPPPPPQYTGAASTLDFSLTAAVISAMFLVFASL
ncbi:hypothetical protein K440DRAFT_677961, partial [Wilcoxina mikolae CBS 423.85]